MTESRTGKNPGSRHRTAAASMVFAAALLAGAPGTQAQEGDAKAILKTMSDYVSAQKTIEVAFDSAIEIITPQLEKIESTNSGGLLLHHPDKLRAHRVGVTPTWRWS